MRRAAHPQRTLARAIGDGAAQFMRQSSEAAHAPSLPRTSVALHRLVVVPRTLIAARTRAALQMIVDDSAALADCDDAVRRFFLEELVAEMDAALERAVPSPNRPVQADEQWACVGVSGGAIWIDQLWSAGDATGHLFLYEFPASGLARRERKALEAAIEALDADVKRLSTATLTERLRLVANR